MQRVAHMTLGIARPLKLPRPRRYRRRDHGGTGGATTAAPAARPRRHRRRDHGGIGGATTAVPAARPRRH
ncbi:hypothetical protein QP743_17965, partial [Sphingomonas zeae]|nr:hypothetical protein [Sphingomonas zeae]